MILTGCNTGRTSDLAINSNPDQDIQISSIGNGAITARASGSCMYNSNLITCEYVGTANGNLWRRAAYTPGWRKIGSPDSSQIVSIAVDTSGGVYVATTAPNTWKLPIPSATWQQINDPKSDQFAYVSALISAGDGNIYAATWDFGFAAILFLKPSEKLPVWALVSELKNLSEKSSRLTTIALDENSNIYAGNENGGVWKYDQSRSSWSKIGSSPDGSGISSLAVKSGTLYVGTTSGNLMSSANITPSKSWTSIFSLDNSSITGLAIDLNGELYASSKNGVFKKSFAGVWEQPIESSQDPISSGINLYQGNLYAGTEAGNAVRLSTYTYLNMMLLPYGKWENSFGGTFQSVLYYVDLNPTNSVILKPYFKSFDVSASGIFTGPVLQQTTEYTVVDGKTQVSVELNECHGSKFS